MPSLLPENFHAWNQCQDLVTGSPIGAVALSGYHLVEFSKNLVLRATFTPSSQDHGFPETKRLPTSSFIGSALLAILSPPQRHAYSR